MHQYILYGFIVFAITESISAASCPSGYVYSNGFCDECGVPDVLPNVKIVGGVQALDRSYPYQALVVQSYKGEYQLSNGVYSTISGSHFCGGTLINRFTVLTAGHCIKHQVIYYDNYNYANVLNTYPTKYYQTLESTFQVYLGITDKNFLTYGGSVPTNGTAVGVQKAIRHEKYDSTNLLNDIGVLILDTPVNISNYIKPACLPNGSFSYPNANTQVFGPGWGLLHEGDTSSPRYLQNVKLTVYNLSYCAYVYPKYTKFWDSQICAGNYSGYQDTCQGDSGGSVYSYDTLGNKSRFIASAVVSYGYGCARSGYPGIYTRVSYFIDWIQYAIDNYKNINTDLNSINSNSNSKSNCCFNQPLLSLIVIMVSTFYLFSFET